MQMNTLTDAELRRLVDNEPRNLAAISEAARRFCEGSTEERGRIEELEHEVEEHRNDAGMYRDTCDELRDTISKLNGENASLRKMHADMKALVNA